MDKREYRYRKHIKWGQYINAISFGFVSLLCLAAPIAHTLISGSIPEYAPMCIAGFLIFAVEGYFLWLMYYKMAGIVVYIEDNKVIYKKRKGEVIVPLDETTRLEFPSVKYLGGWVKIVSSTENIRLTVVIENIGGFLQELKASLDQKELSHSYNEKKMASFFKTAVYSDQSWERLYSIFWKLTLSIILSAILGALATYSAGLHLYFVIAVASASVLWPTVIYLLTEALFGRYLAKKSDPESLSCPARDPAYEKAIYTKAIGFGCLIFLAALITAVLLLK